VVVIEDARPDVTGVRWLWLLCRSSTLDTLDLSLTLASLAPVGLAYGCGRMNELEAVKAADVTADDDAAAAVVLIALLTLTIS
jgi:hypothetical protein